jgi:cytochrome c oxidase subunit 2
MKLDRFSTAAAVSVALACGGCREAGVLDPASEQALLIELLWWVFFWVSVFVLGGVVIALGIALARGLRRRRSQDYAVDLSPERRLERSTARAVSAATALSVLILAGLLVASVATGRELFRAQPTLYARVVAHQWWWEIQYLGPTPDTIMHTANELHLPAGVAIELELKSADVIHSFWVPNLQGKRDLIPGHTSRIVLVPERVGRYEGRCAEFCGLQHAKMELVVVVEPPSRFSAWLEAQRRPAEVPVQANARRGAELFVRGPCALCHAVTGTDASASAGPDLTHLASRVWLGAGAIENSKQNLRLWLTDTQLLKPGVQMPPTVMSQRDLDDLVAYLGTLR